MSGIIHEIFNQYYTNTVLLPLDYDNLKELEAELTAEIESQIKKLVDMDDGKNKYQTLVNRGSINALQWLIGKGKSQ